MTTKLDILFIVAHPDDAEMSSAGTIAKHVAMGKKVGIVDLTRGEMGTRGSAEVRDQEAALAAEILGLAARENLGLRDAWFGQTEEEVLAVIRAIRKYQPDILICNAEEDRHPDHGKGAELAEKAAFLSGLRRIATESNGLVQEPWRPKVVLHCIQNRMIKPDVVIDITGFEENKKKAIGAYKSQFYDPNSDEPVTFIATEHFWNFIEARDREFGNMIGVPFAEGYTSRARLTVPSFDALLG